MDVGACGFGVGSTREQSNRRGARDSYGAAKRRNTTKHRSPTLPDPTGAFARYIAPVVSRVTATHGRSADFCTRAAIGDQATIHDPLAEVDALSNESGAHPKVSAASRRN